MVARPLVLKSQVGRPGKLVSAETFPIARVLVDTGVYHLDSTYDYLVPEIHSGTARVGIRVEVPFGTTVCEGIIVERVEEPERSGELKQISKVLSPHQVATVESLEIIRKVAKRWAANSYDVIRSAIPPRVLHVDRAFVASTTPLDVSQLPKSTQIPSTLMSEKICSYWALPPLHNCSELLVDLIRARSAFGQVLVIVPDEWTLQSLFLAVQLSIPTRKCVRIDAHVSRSDRYRNFLQAVDGQANLVFGMRGAVFLPLIEGSTIIIVGESSHHLYEKRTPGWNARDVAILRAEIQGTSLLLVGYSPSLETARLIDQSFLNLVSSKQRRAVSAYDSTNGELLPSKVFSLIRKSLKVGPVLFLVPSRGYGNAVLCSKCRNIALCKCGGKLQRRSAQADPECAICRAQYPLWQCEWCQSSIIFITSRGIDRFAEEIGRSFPNFSIINSSGDHIIRTAPGVPSLVISTPGAMPRVDDGYAGVVLLQGTRFFGHSDLRSHERAKDLFFETASLASSAGEICVVIDPVHPIVAALNRWDPTIMARKELSEQEEAQLPPYWRVAILELATSEAVLLAHGLEKARDEKRLPPRTAIRGPFEVSLGNSRITVSAPMENSQEMIDFLHELQRKRSMSRKSLLDLRVDPYSLG